MVCRKERKARRVRPSPPCGAFRRSCATQSLSPFPDTADDRRGRRGGSAEVGRVSHRWTQMSADPELARDLELTNSGNGPDWSQREARGGGGHEARGAVVEKRKRPGCGRPAVLPCAQDGSVRGEDYFLESSGFALDLPFGFAYSLFFFRPSVWISFESLPYCAIT